MEIIVKDKGAAEMDLLPILKLVESLPEPAAAITTAAEEQGAIMVLGTARNLGDQLGAKYDELAKGALDYLETLKAIFKPGRDRLEALDGAIRAACCAYHETAGGEKTIKTPGGSMTYAERAGAIIDTPDDVPRNYLTPDVPKIAAALKAGLKVKGCRLQIKLTPTFRGAK